MTTMILNTTPVRPPRPAPFPPASPLIPRDARDLARTLLGTVASTASYLDTPMDSSLLKCGLASLMLSSIAAGSARGAHAGERGGSQLPRYCARVRQATNQGQELARGERRTNGRFCEYEDEGLVGEPVEDGGVGPG